MTGLGISLITIGITLVCAGVAFRPRAPRTDRPGDEGPDEFRTILDGLNEDDRRHEKLDPGEPSANDPPADPAAEAMAQPGRQRRPQLG